MSINYSELTIAEFEKHISSYTEQEQYDKILKGLNEQFMEYADNILKLNEKKNDIIEKMRLSQTQMKRIIGIKEIDNKQNDNNGDNENTEVKETKNKSKKNKEVKIEAEAVVEPVVEVKETKTKGKKTKEVAEPVVEAVVKPVVEVKETKTKSKKTKEVVLDQEEEPVKETKTKGKKTKN
jgi:hypothetical protein